MTRPPPRVLQLLRLGMLSVQTRTMIVGIENKGKILEADLLNLVGRVDRRSPAIKYRE